MTARELCLAAVLAPQPTRGLVVVLKGSNEVEDETASRWNIGKVLSPFAVLAEGTNTWEEAQWAVQQAEHDLTIVTSAYHQLRAFLTFLRALELADTDRTILLWNRSTWSPLTHLETEWRKIRTYCYRGHVASYRRAQAYLIWRDARSSPNASF